MLFQIAACAILVVFYGCYFIKLLAQRRQGIQTNLLGKEKEGFVKFVEITLQAVTFTVPLVEIVSIALDWNYAPFYLRIAGVVISAAGVVVFIIAVLQMKDSWRAGVPKEGETKLVTEGIYRFSRNPAFLGFDLIYIGILFMFLNLPLYVVSMLAVIMLHLQIVNVEEDFLIEAFGDEYLAYQKKVCRYFGRRNRD